MLLRLVQGYLLEGAVLQELQTSAVKQRWELEGSHPEVSAANVSLV